MILYNIPTYCFYKAIFSVICVNFQEVSSIRALSTHWGDFNARPEEPINFEWEFPVRNALSK